MKNNTIMKSLMLLMVAGTVVLFSACGGSAIQDEEQRPNVDLLGAGATFPAPLITAMADEYRDMTDGRVTLNYQSIGSGGGIRQFIEQTIMFGMTEAFLNDEVMGEISQATGGKAFNLPITLADVVATYNLPGIDKGLVFTGDLLVAIFMGRINNWNNPRIAELNPGITFPNMPITVVHRSDGSGTTNIWTSYLSRISTEWAERVGFGTSVSWPVGVGGNGNEGVAGAVMNSPGAIGYNSLSYALINNMAFGSVINSSGNTIVPSFAATTEAANIDLPEDTRVLFTNTPAPKGYPIAGFAWMLIHENLDKNNAISTRDQALDVVEFVIWAITEGQELSETLGYARLPQAAVDRNINMIKQIKWKGEMIGEAMLKNHKLL
jgi:phosphate transport system substrate-binding protein